MYIPFVNAQVRHEELLREAEERRLIAGLRSANPQPSVLSQMLNAILQRAQAQKSAAPIHAQIEMDSGVFSI